MVDLGDVRLVRVYPEIPGLGEPAPRVSSRSAPGITGAVDRRFRARDDGSIDGWLLPA